MVYDNLVLELNVPSIAYNSNFSRVTIHNIHEVEIDGVLYNDSNFNDVMYTYFALKVDTDNNKILAYFVGFHLTGDRVMTYFQVFQNLDVTNKSLKIKGTTANIENNFPDNWVQYITVLGDSFTATIRGSNAYALNNPSLNNRNNLLENDLLIHVFQLLPIY